MRRGTVPTKYSIYLWLSTNGMNKKHYWETIFAESWKDSGRNLSKHSDFNIGGWNVAFFFVQTIYVLYLLPEHTLEIAESLSDRNDETNKEDSVALCLKTLNTSSAAFHTVSITLRNLSFGQSRKYNTRTANSSLIKSVFLVN